MPKAKDALLSQRSHEYIHSNNAKLVQYENFNYCHYLPVDVPVYESTELETTPWSDCYEIWYSI